MVHSNLASVKRRALLVVPFSCHCLPVSWQAQSTFEALYSEFDDAPPELRATMKAQMGTMGTVTAAALKENDRRIQEQADAARRAESDRRIKEQSDRLESLLGELTLEVEPAEEEAKASVAAVQAVVQAHLPPEKALEAAREAEETLAVARKALESAMATVRKDVAMLEASVECLFPCKGGSRALKTSKTANNHSNHRCATSRLSHEHA